MYASPAADTERTLVFEVKNMCVHVCVCAYMNGCVPMYVVRGSMDIPGGQMDLGLGAVCCCGLGLILRLGAETPQAMKNGQREKPSAETALGICPEPNLLHQVPAFFLLDWDFWASRMTVTLNEFLYHVRPPQFGEGSFCY